MFNFFCSANFKKKLFFFILFLFYLFIGISNISYAQTTLVDWDFRYNSNQGWTSHAQSGTNSWNYNSSYWGNGQVSDPQYNVNEHSWIYSPEIILPSFSSASLVFNASLDVKNNRDSGFVDISTDNFTTYTTLAKYSSDLSPAAERTLTIPSSFQNQNIRVRIRIKDNGSQGQTAEGWRVYYVRITYTPPTGTISGNVRRNVINTGVQGVTITVRSGSTVIGTTTTNANGDYSIVVPVGSGYTITPTFTGYSFTPTSINNVTVTEGGNNSGNNFVVNGGVVSGVVNGPSGPLNGVTITATGGYTTNTNSNGEYQLFIPTGGSTNVTITPSLSGYTFVPSSQTVTVTNGNTTTQNFYGSNCGRIYGYVTIDSTPARYFPVHLTGYQNRTVLTDANGFYEFTDLPRPNACGGGNVTSVNYVVSVQPHVTSITGTGDLYHTVALTATDYIQRHDFNPAYLNNSSFNISGNVRAIIGGTLQNQDGVNVLLQRNRITDTQIDSWEDVGTVVTSGGTGNYSFTNLIGRYQYRLIVTKAGYYYEPTDFDHRNLDQGYIYFIDLPGPKTDQNFIGTPKTFKISGNVKAETSPGGPQANKSNVLVTIYNGPGADNDWNTLGDNIVYNTQLTDANGNYSFDAQVGGDYMVAASSPGYNFTPAHSNVWSNLSANQSQDFTGTLIPYDLTGVVSNLLVSAPHNHQATILLYEAGNPTPIASVNTTSGSESYSFGSTKIYVNKQYIVSVAPFSGYSFTPSQVAINNPVGNQVANFVAIRGMFEIKGFVDGVDYTNPNLVGEEVKLSCPGSVENEVFVKGDGTEEYTFHVMAFGSYTVTPTMDGHNFRYNSTTDPSHTYNLISSSISNENYHASIKTYTISGRVLDDNGNGVNGVTINITNTGNIPGYTGPIITDATGNFSYTVNARQNYTLTPTKTGVTIVPVNASFTDIKDNVVQFFFTTVLKTWKVTGYVTKNSTSGVAVPNATVTIKRQGSPDIWAVTVSDANGKYEFLGVNGHSYEITGSKAGYTVTSTPSPVIVSNLSSDYTIPSNQNLVATPIRYNVSGNITGLASGVDANVELQVERPGPTWVTVATLTTNNNFTFNNGVEVDSNYKVIATATGYTIYPPDGRIYSNPVSDITNANFNVATDVQTISGQITGVNPSHMPVTVNCEVRSGGTGVVITHAVVTDASGNYTITVSANGNYRVTPSRLGYNFTNSYKDVDVGTSSVNNVNFTGTLRTHTISGYVNNFNSAHGPATITITPNPVSGSNTQSLPNATTQYSFIVNELDYYTITPSLNGYTITPPSKVFANITSDQTQNFVATINKVKISGTITKLGSPLQGVMVTCTGQTSQYTDADGKYVFIVDPFNNYTVAPYKAGYSFTPTSSNITNITSDEVRDFTANTNKYTISGTVFDFNGTTPLAGVELSCNNGTSTRTMITAGDGNYSFEVYSDSTYTITPYKVGQTFNPNYRVFINPTDNISGQNFRAEQTTYTVTGYAYINDNPPVLPIPNAQIKVFGVPSYTTTTDANGKYTFTAIAGQSYQIQASKPGLNFINSPLNTPPITDNTTLDTLLANRNQYHISGTIYNYDGTTPLSGVTVYCDGNTSGISMITDTTGRYNFPFLEGGYDYKIRPEKTGFVFNPIERNYEGLDSNYTEQNFRAEQSTVLVTGYVKINGTSNGLQGVQIEVNGNPSAVTFTDATGKYTFTGLVGQAYSIVATKAGWNIINSPLSSGVITGSTTLTDLLAEPLKYTISGQVKYFDGSPLSGVTITCNNGTNSRSIVTDNTGNYSFEVSADSNYTITPQKLNLVFNPDNRYYQNPSGNYSNQDFKAEQNAVTVTGRVVKVGTTTGLKDVIISISGNPNSVTATDDNGYYRFTALVGQTYSISGSKTGWSITSINNVLITGTMSVSDLIATPQTFTISGKVKYFNDTPLSGVTVSCNNGTNSRSIVTDNTGEYSFTVSSDSNYIISPSRTGFVFNPDNRNYNNPTQSLDNQDFKAEQNAVTVTGYVYKNGTTTGVKDVIITISGNPSATTATDNNGKYTFTALIGQSYQVSGTKNGWSISPNPLNTGEIISNTTIDNLYATPLTYTVSGTVYNFDNNPLSGVTVTCDNGTNSRSIVTDNTGNYSFEVSADSNYTITPQKNGYKFNPVERKYDNPVNNYSLQNFTAEQSSYTITGYVKHNSSGLEGVTIIVNGTPSTTTTTDADGKFIFTAFVGNSYSVSAAKIGYSITSINGNPQSVGPVYSNQSIPDFIATTLNNASIQGKVYSSGSLLAGATVRLYKNGNLESTQTTSVPPGYSSYSYSFTNLETNQDYKVTVEKAGFTFIPNEDGTGNLGVKYFNDLIGSVEQDFASNVSTKTISGNVHSTTSNIANVTVNITSSSFNTNAVTGSDGNFTTTVPAGIEYILSVQDVPDIGYSFVNADTVTRTTRYSGIVVDNVVGMDFLANVKTYNIKVNIAGVDQGDVVNFPDIAGSGLVQITGDVSGAGTYTYTNVPGLTDYTITPQSTEWNFNPSTVTYTNLIGNKEITFTAVSKKQYTISGKVTRNLDGPLSGVVLNISPGSQVVSTDANGNYSFIVDAGSSYTITPSTTTGTGKGYNFSPGDSTINTISDNVTNVDFVATPIGGLSIQGTIYNGGAPLADATVTLSYTPLGGSLTTININTGINGTYIFDGLEAHNDYTVTVHKNGFAFIPNKGFNDGYKLFEDMIISQVQDFASNTSNAAISGNISNSVPSGIANVPVKITSLSFNTNAITDNNGNYEALVPVGLDYHIEPLTNPDQGYHYQNTDNPTLNYRQTGYLSGNLTGQNFLAIVNNYSISGTILGLTSETVTLNLYDITGGGNVLFGTTNATPPTYTYSFNNVPGLRDYFIVPVLNDYAFNPTNRTLLNLIGNKVDQNFAATKALGPVLISPLNGAQNVPVQPTFVWAPPIVGPTPTNYKLQVSTSTDFTGALEYTGNVLTYNGFTLNPSTVYYWRVQSQSISGNNWSEIWSFTTSLSSPTLVSPACGSTTSVNPTLVWNVVPLATGYDVELKNTSTSVITQYYNLSTTSLNITGLSNFTTYEWRVRAKNAGGASNWSSWCAFTTDASIPALKSPLSGSVGQPVNITFEWYSVPGATQYTLEYSTNPNFTPGTTTTFDVSGTSKPVTNLAINTTYFWRVKVKAPVQSQYSEVWYFSVGGAFSWAPQNIDFGDVLVGKTKSENVTITNNGATPIIIYVDVNGNQFNSPNKVENPITIAPGAVKEITVNFAPTSTGIKTGKLLIQHNVSSQPLNPVEIPLTGRGVSTFATLTLPALIDFGTVVFNSGSRDTIITVYNNSTISGDYVHITSATFENPTGGIFEIITPFPIILEPGTTYPVKIRFNPNALGVQQNAFHVMNTTLNPDVRVQVRANVLQGDLVVTPAYVDFGKTTKTEPYKDTTIAIQNNSAQPITITSKYIVGDTNSFTLDNPSPIILQPNQTNYVKVRFFPRTAGRKTAIFTITSNYVLAPILYVPLTGIGGEEPVLYVDMQTIDFGILQKGQIKDTTVTIRNDGSLDLNITGKEFIGTDKAMFSFVNDGSPIVLRGGESRTIILRATGMLPIGPKNAQLKLTSNDPNNPIYMINLLATVRSTVLFKSVERIIFDTVDIGYSVDTSFVIRNDGDLNALISKFELEGPFASDFKLLNITTPFELSPGESKLVLLRFAPLAIGLRYAQIVINVNDPLEPVQRIIVQGWGRNVSTNPIITVDGNQTGEPIVDFGRVPIFEIRTKDIGIKNLAKYSKLRIDTMYVDSIYKQPFGYGNITFPFYINPNDLKLLTLSFNPKDKVKSYAANLNIQYSDSTMPPNKNNVIKIRMVGSVIFPGMDFDLTPVLKFGKVISGQSLKREFDIINRGESYLIVDSMVITGEDASEFVINDKTPIRIEPDTKYTSSVTFFAKKVGSKDAKVIVYSNDLFKLGEIEIWAECIVSGGQTTGITKTDEVPTSYNLQQNYPNPFNPSTKIEYSLPEATHVSIRIFNSLGQEVAVLVNEMQSAGKYIVDWQPKNLPSGIYFYKMQSSKYTSIRKMMLLK